MTQSPPPTLPYQSPRPPDDWTATLEIAKRQKIIIWLVLLELACAFPTIILVPVSAPPGLAGLLMLYMMLFRLVMCVVWLWAVFTLLRALKSGVGEVIAATVLLAAGLLVPFLSLLVLLGVNQRATRRLRHAGLKVGLLGAKIPDGPPVPHSTLRFE